jgi:DHA3 family tetracycline resistance protein-like MFS transporter
LIKSEHSLRHHNPKTVYWIGSFVVGIIFSIVFSANQLYRVQTVGLNPLQLVLVGTALEVTAFIFEVPTGVIADLISRRLSVILGTFLFGIGFLLEAAFPIFAWIILAQVIWGIAWTFISGAHSAWITDEVGLQGVGPVFLRASQLNMFGSLAGIPLFILLGNVSYRLPIIVGGGLFLFLGLYRLIAMPETRFIPTPREKRDTFQQMVTTFKQGINLARVQPVLLTFAIISIFVGLYSEGYDRLSEAHFIQQFTFPPLPWGGDPMVFWFAGMRVVGTFLSLATTEMVKRRVDTTDNVRMARLLSGIYALISLGLFVFAWSGNFYLAIAATLLVDTMRSLTDPLIDTWVNKYIESKVRATMLSMTSQLDALGQMIGGPVVGVIGNLHSIKAALTTSALLILTVVPLYSKTAKQTSQSVNSTLPAQENY